jgi:hypothetical protein
VTGIETDPDWNKQDTAQFKEKFIIKMLGGGYPVTSIANFRASLLPMLRKLNITFTGELFKQIKWKK